MTQEATRKNKFILADPSAIHTGGHHYEYAVRILSEAKDQGYEPELWAHKDAELPNDLFAIVKCFTNSFYQNMGSRKGGRVLKQVSNGKIMSVLQFKFIEKLKNFFYYIILETSFGVAISRAKYDGARDQFRPNYNAAYNEIKTSKVTYTILYALYKLYKILYEKKRLLLFFVKFLIVIAGVLLLPILIPLGIFFVIYTLLLIKKDSAEVVFARDMRTQLMAQDWQSNDVIFVPTCFFVEAGAMVELLTRWSPDKIMPQLHLLFRTNVFSGYTNEYRAQLEGQLAYRAAFKWLFASDYKNKLYCYTDTPQLSQQYKVLSDEWFEPLPVPVPWTVDKNKTTKRNKSLTIAYVGDVRDEKGYQYYPGMVDHLWDDYIATGDVRFILQSNYADNLNVSQESAVAHSVLSGYSEEYIKHIEGPLSSKDYKSLIDDSDIILLTYYPHHYMARSSGIFIEAMKAGKPVVMPAQTWMAALVEENRQDRWKEAIKELSRHKKVSLSLKQSKWMRCEDKKISYIILKAQFDIPSEETGFLELVVRKFDRNNFVVGEDDVTVSQIHKDGAVYCMVSVSDDCDYFELRYNVYGARTKTRNIEVYTSNKPWEGTRDFAAVVYPYQEQSYINKAMTELIDHYDQYAAQAKSFADTRGDYFTPKTLVQNIVKRSKSGDVL